MGNLSKIYQFLKKYIFLFNLVESLSKYGAIFIIYIYKKKRIFLYQNTFKILLFNYIRI